MIQPIAQYPHYYFQSGRLIGLSENILDEGLVVIDVWDTDEHLVTVKDFFKKDNVLYIETIETENTGTEEEPVIEQVTHYYSQTNGTIKEIEALPEPPAIGYSTHNSKNFTVLQDSYESEPISRIKNNFMKSQAVFKQVFGIYEIEKGLFVNVIESKIPGKHQGFISIQKTEKQ